MHKTSQITLVVPCYNQASFLDEALRTVFNQSYEFWECIIVNDGSIDNTAALAKSWVDKDDRFSYVYKENAGLSSARNTGVKLSKTSYILPFDSDDKLHKNHLKKAMDVLLNNSDIEVLTTKVQHFGVKNNILELPKYSFKTLLSRNCFIACSIFKKSTFDRVGGYDENLKSFEDWDFWIRALKDGGKHYEINEVLYYYRKHKSESLSNRFLRDEEFYTSLYDYVYKKHRSLYDQYFPNFILLYADYLEMEAFSDKVKRNFMFKIYHSVKVLFKK
jgi:glycosyltransferase involved in cell wall biosynthesis